MQLSHSLSEDWIARRYAFAREYRKQLEGNPGVLNVTRFADEHTSTWMGTSTSKMSDFGPQRVPRLTVADPLSPERVTLWCALSSGGIFGAVFVDGTVTSGAYLSLLSDELTFSWWDMATQPVKPDFKKTAPDLTLAMPYFPFCMKFSRRFLSKWWPAILEEGSSWAPT
jgi:hypothetical protein